MSQRPHTEFLKNLRSQHHSVFELQNAKSEENVLSHAHIRSAKRSGELSLCGRGLGFVPENVWKIDELVLEEHKEVDLNRSYSDRWWTSVSLKTLDLSSNAIVKISSDIKLLQELVNLKLHDNALELLPPEIGELKNLNLLMLGHNKLTGLPMDFYKLTELRILDLSHNHIESIPPNFGDLVMLKRLDLSHNRLMSLPPGLGYLIRLIELNLSHNQLSELPPDIVNLRDLKKMDVTHNSLKYLPPLGELRRMDVLEANHNDITELPNFEGCAALKEVYLANNFIKEITEEFCETMQHLSVLNLRDNQLEVLPENISLLKNLKRLDITNNDLNKLPKNLGLLSQLQSLRLEGNRFTSVRQDLLRGGTERILKYLRDHVNEDSTGEASSREPEWPNKHDMKKLQCLQLSGKELTSIPEEVLRNAGEVKVHAADLSRNKLSSVPLGITCLSESLTELIISSNCLSQVPAELAECSNIQFLELSKNSLSDLPLDLGRLKNLRELVIAHNKFTKIPRCVYEMDKLEILLAGDNQITEINVSSDALARLTNLAVLDLINNSISSVPPELGNFTQIRSLELMGNCFRQPRHAVLEKGTASILSYLRDRIPK